MNPLPKVVSFSFGQTSALMTSRLIKQYGRDGLLIIFENTGREHEETIAFGKRFASEEGVEIILLEYRRTLAKTINLEQVRDGQARRNLEARQSVNGAINWFEQMTWETLSKRGSIGPFDYLLEWMSVLPNVVARACSKNLKTEVMFHYLWSKGIFEWNEFIGIRCDEAHRSIEIKAKSPSYRHVHFPLVDDQITKQDVEAHWLNQSYHLRIPNHLGNCDGCFLKRRWKLERFAKDEPNHFDWWIKKEQDRKHKGQGGKWSNAFGYQEIKNAAEHPELNLTTDNGEDIPCSCAVSDATKA